MSTATSAPGALQRLDEGSTLADYLHCAQALESLDPREGCLAPLKIGVLRNFTVEPLLPVLKTELARAGFAAEFHLGDFDVVVQAAMDPESAFHRSQPEIIFLGLWLETLSPQLCRCFVTLGPERATAAAAETLEQIQTLLAALRQHSSVPILLNNFPLPIHPTLGILDAQHENYHTGTILGLNRQLQRLAGEFRDVYVVDYLSLFARLGSRQAIDPRYWLLARSPLSRNVLVPLAQEYTAFVRALRGKTRKCLVFDCDNTLWGGVVGEDGPDGIRLGDDYPGNAFRAFQEAILDLHARGVILALCSKNEESSVREVLREHPAMLLREEHFATWQINWTDKATNLRQIASDLNIGLDSVVFVDDSSFECTLVREQLPEVAVVQLTAEPADYVQLLARGHFFDSLTFSAEDRQRTDLYHQEADRKRLQIACGSIEEYLSRLEIVAEIGRPDAQTIPRVAQLTQKTNQFNLTTRRYAEGEITAFVEREDADVFSLRLRDRLSDLGLIGVAIVVYTGACAEIDTFLLSCRALGRGAEDALLAYLLNQAAARGCSRVRGCYRATAKNAQVAQFYPARRFEPYGEKCPERVQWHLELAAAAYPYPSWIRVIFA